MARSTSQPSDSTAVDGPVGLEAGLHGLADDATANDIAEVIAEESKMLATMGPNTMTLIEWLAARSDYNDQDEAAAMEDMIGRAMNSATPDQVFAESMAVKVDSIINRPIQIMGFRIAETEFAEGFPYYALIDAAYGNPVEKHVITCGGFKILAQLYALDKLGEWPQVCMFTKPAKATKNGYYPLSLVRAV